MSWVTVIWSMIASACLTLAAIYALVWYRQRTTWAHLYFSLTAASTAAFALIELWMMRAQTPAELRAALMWLQLPLLVWLVSLVWFVRTYLGAGRLWLAWTICGMRFIYALLSFAIGQLNLREVSAGHVDFLGESVTVLGGVSNPMMLFGQSAGVLLLIFVADASVTVWRRGDRRKALIVGGSVELFVLGAFVMSLVVLWAHVEAPIVFSAFYLGLVTVMGYELSRDVLRASLLVHDLQASEAELRKSEIELRKSEAGLRESEARMTLAVDAADLGLWIWDLGHNDIWASDKWRELFAFSPSERLEFSAILERLHPDDREALRRVHASAVATANGGRYQTEYRLLLPDGSIRWISSMGRIEIDAAGQPVLMRGASREVTARKRAEQEAQVLRQEIAHAGRVSMLGQLASGLAHEIHQPLAAILRNVEAAELLMLDPSPDLDEIRAIHADVRTDDERAGHVIDRMRALLERHTLDTRRLDVGALVNEVAALMRVDAAAREVKLDVGVPADVPPVRGDRVHLQQVLLNLIFNGMDALKGATPENRRVGVTARVNAASGGRMVEIGVDDTGPGIPTDTLAHIFEPFFTTKSSGMGMGLAISRTIVEAHAGQIWAENRVGGGAAFRFTVPVAEEEGTP
jgi:two-component system, LuxR family, sensor kinase FixL